MAEERPGPELRLNPACPWLAGGMPNERFVTEKKGFAIGAHTGVMAVTDPVIHLGETANVNMVQRASKKALLEPGDTKQQWKGEAAASFVCAGIASSRTLPTSSVGYWFPLLSCVSRTTSASEAKFSFGGDFLA